MTHPFVVGTERIRLTDRYEGGGASIGVPLRIIISSSRSAGGREYFHWAGCNMNGWVDLYERRGRLRLSRFVSTSYVATRVLIGWVRVSICAWLTTRPDFGHASVRYEGRRFPQGGIFLEQPTLRCHHEIGGFGHRETCLVARLSRLLFS